MSKLGFAWHDGPDARPGPNTSRYAFREGDTEDPAAVNYYMPIVKSTIFIHLVGLYGLTQAAHAATPTLVLAFVFLCFGVVGTFAGMHRLWSHRSYDARPALEWLLMYMVSTVHSISILHWVHDHRMHHKYSDTDFDPHNAQRGFFYSHMGWVLYELPLPLKRAGQALRMDDMYKNPIVVWQHRHYKSLAPVLSYLLPTAIAATWGDAWGGFWVAGFARVMVTLHLIWTTASFAHLGYGERKYNEKLPPVENMLVSLMSFGEGYHSYHHAYPHDYCASRDHYQPFNFNTIFIDAMAALGLVGERRRACVDGRPDRKREMTMETVKNECQQGRKLLVIKSCVYDVSDFARVHPGGEIVMKAYYGRDATESFNTNHNLTVVGPTLDSLQCGVIGYGKDRKIAA